MSGWVSVIIALLRVLIPALVQASKPVAEDGDPQFELRDRLRKRVRETWGHLAPVLLCLFVLTGCTPRTIYVSDGTPVRIRERVKAAKVWVQDKDGNPAPGVMDLPEGWYALPIEPKEEK